MAALPKLPKKFKLWRVVYDKGALSNLSLDEIRNRINAGAFQPIDDDPYTFSSKGVVSIIDIDHSTEQDDVAFGSWVMFNWRKDERKADKKAVDRILKKRIAKLLKDTGGEFVSRNTKNEIKAQIVDELRSRSEPIPSVMPIYIHPESDSIFYPVSSEKKLEAIAEEIEGLLDTGRGQETIADFDTDMGMDWLENLWHSTMSGQLGPQTGLNFYPKTVGNEEAKTTSDDATDLAFGKLNSKRCLAGVIEYPDESTIAVNLNPRQLSMTIMMEDAKPESAELWAEELALRLDMVMEKFDTVEKLAQKRDASGIDETCRINAGGVLAD